MNPILLAVIIVAAIGLIAGLGLSIASKVFAVPVDEKAEAINKELKSFAKKKRKKRKKK
jgi:Na+-translocating ferredoxin:NAD+ oxidoreductase RNF subunit RnfB